MPTNLDTRQALDPVVLLDEHGDYLYRFALLLTRDSAIAEDLVQETLLSAMRGCERPADQASERRWLEGILRQRLSEHFRLNATLSKSDSANEKEHLELDFFEKSGEWTGHWREDQAPVGWRLEATDLIQAQAFWQTFDHSLADLPRRAVIAFTLREIDGLGTEEVCELLGLKQRDLWVMLHCVRAKLRQALEQEWFRDRDCCSSKPPGIAGQLSRDAANYPSVAA